MKAEQRIMPPGETDSSAEEQFVSAARMGGEAAFEALYDKYKRYVYSLCLRVATNPAGAEELTRRIFLAAFRSIGAVHGEAGFSNCLRQAAVSENLAYLRSQREMRQTGAGPHPASSPSKPRKQKRSGVASEEPCADC
ncbi:MAG: hypothetical protein KGM47_13640 [Acidobacteriota bacterium]|nr:hypothetical protein [Acidobacteriota bacterium]